LGKPILQRSLKLLSRFSLRSQYRLGDLLGMMLRSTSNQVSRQARENIGLCFADLDRGQQRALYRDSMRHTCYAMTELASLWYWPVERVLATITSFDICDEFDASERSRIILVPHLGSWETLAVWLGQHCNAIMLYKRRKNRALDNFIREARARSGGELVPTKKRGLRQLLIGLKKGRTLMILPDQRPGGKKAYIESTFFGYSAPTTTLVQNLCSKIDCDVFIANMCRSQPPGEFSLRIQALEHARLAADDVSSAQYMNDQIEALARLHPAQYQWGYRRFDASAYASAKQES
jgi:KDO2-lipid IV(A) lauroyltransferase